MDSKLAKEVERLAADALEVGDEIELASDEDATPEVIEQARRMTADFLDQYNSLLERLSGEDKLQVQRTIGGKVERMNKLLAKLR